MPAPPEIKCQKCGKPASPGMPVCPACGGRLVRACPACGALNSAAKHFCDSCAASLDAAAAPTKPAENAPASPPKPEISFAPEHFEKVQAPLPRPRRDPEAEKRPASAPEEKAPPKPAPAPEEKAPPKPEEKPLDSARGASAPEEKTPPEPAPAPAPEEKAPPKPAPAPAPEEKAPPKPAPAPAPEEKAPPKPEEKVEIKLPPPPEKKEAPRQEEGQPAEKAPPKPAPDPEKRPPASEKLELKPAAPAEPPKDAEAERRRRIAEFDMPKTVISRLPDRHKTPKSRPVPPEKAPEKPREEPPRKESEKPKTSEPPRKEPAKPESRRTPHPREDAKPLILPKAEPPRRELPKPAPKAPASGDPADRFRKPDAPQRPAAQPRPREKVSAHTASGRPVASTMAGLALLVVGLVVYGGYWWRYKQNPRAALLRTAARYVTSLVAGDSAAAYGFLSERSRAEVSADEFKRSVPPPGGTLGPVDVEVLDTDWALVRYDAAAPGAAAATERIAFVREDGRWLRAYAWPTLLRTEAALASGDPAAAAQAATKAAAIDPREPLAKAYLCESAYARAFPPDARTADAVAAREAHEACRVAIDLAKRYPSTMNESDLFHLHALLASLYRDALDKPGEAVREYGILLALPHLSAPDRCDILLARADARAGLTEYKGALTDYQEAVGLCPAGDDASYAKASAAVFSGAAGTEAVSLVQRRRMPDDESTVLEWRTKASADLKRRFSGKGALKPAPDSWTPEYAGGPNYRVTLRSADLQLLTAQVDLWNQTVKVDFHVR